MYPGATSCLVIQGLLHFHREFVRCGSTYTHIGTSSRIMYLLLERFVFDRQGSRMRVLSFFGRPYMWYQIAGWACMASLHGIAFLLDPP
jgi:hypothetical protein